MITLQHVHYEIHDEVGKNDKVHNSFIKKSFIQEFYFYIFLILKDILEYFELDENKLILNIIKLYHWFS